MDIGDLAAATIGYAWWWPALGGLAIALLVGWLVFVFLANRKPKPPKPTPPPTRSAITKAREAALERIGAIEAEYAAGDLTERGLHAELSATVRDFAKVRAHVNAPVLTLTELRSFPQAAPVADAVAQYYQPEFAAVPLVQGAGAIATAREVVARW